MSITPYAGDLPSLARPTAFSADATEVFAWLTGTVVPEFNATEATLSAAAMGALSVPMVFSTDTTVADPTAGKIRLNNATQSSATALLVDLMDSAGTDRTAFLDAWDDSTSAVKGVVGIMAAGDPSKWLAFNVSAVAAPSGYRNVSVTHVGGSSASPFADGDAVVLAFQRSGDAAALGWTEIASYTVSGAPNSFDLANIPGTYTDLLCEVRDLNHSNSTRAIELRLGRGASVYGPRSLAPATTLALNGSILIPRYGANRFQLINGVGQTGASDGVEAVGSSSSWRIAGGLDLMRFTVSSSGNFANGGSVVLFGR